MYSIYTKGLEPFSVHFILSNLYTGQSTKRQQRNSWGKLIACLLLMQHFHEVICEHLLYSKAIAAPNVKKNYRSTHLVILNQTNYWSTNLLFEIIRSWADKILFIGTKFFQFTQIVLKQFYFRSQPVGFFDKFLQSYFSNWELHLPLYSFFSIQISITKYVHM